MNALILAAGYATRLYPLTLNKAKPLLDVAGKPMIEWVLDNLAPIPELETVYVVTNNKFVKDFQRWAEGYRQRQPGFTLKIIDDGSTDDSDKLGAIGDINLVLTREENMAKSDLIIVAGDNLFSEPLVDFVNSAKDCEALLAEADPQRVMLDEFDHWILLRRNLRRLRLEKYRRLADPGQFLNDFVEFFSRCQDELVSGEDYQRYADGLAARLEAERETLDEDTLAERLEQRLRSSTDDGEETAE